MRYSALTRIGRCSYNFLLVIRSNHGPILYRFQDIARKLQSRKLQIFPTRRALNAPVEG